MEKNFNIGDVIQLKSGGSKMVIEVIDDIDDEGKCLLSCVYFNKITGEFEYFGVDSKLVKKV